MNLEQMKEIAAKRTKGEWINSIPNHPESNFRLFIGNTIWPMDKDDAEFIAMAANNFDKLIAENEDAIEHNTRLCDSLKRIRHFVDEQAEDETIWFEAETAPEAYLLEQLRKLHEIIENES